MRRSAASSGFLLADACIALAMAGVLALSAASVNAHLGAARSALEPALQARSAGSAAMSWLGDQIRQAGAVVPPETVDAKRPVSAPLRPALSAEAAGGAGDRLIIHHESRTDCLGNTRVSGQSYVDATREPRVLTQTNHIYVSRSASGGPSLMCDPDGPGSANAQAFSAHIEALRLRFRLRDSNDWFETAAVKHWEAVQAVEVCLVLSGGTAEGCPSAGSSRLWSPRLLVGVFALRNGG